MLMQAQLQRCSTSISFRLAASLVRFAGKSLFQQICNLLPAPPLLTFMFRRDLQSAGTWATITPDCKSSERGFSSVSADKPAAAATREESPPRSSPQRVPGGSSSSQKKSCDLGAACFEKTTLQVPVRRFSPNLLLLSRPNCKYVGPLSLCKRLIIKYFCKSCAPS